MAERRGGNCLWHWAGCLGASQPGWTPCPVHADAPEQGPCCVWTPGPQVSQWGGLGDDTCLCEPWFTHLCSGHGASRPHGVLRTIEKCLASSTEQAPSVKLPLQKKKQQQKNQKQNHCEESGWQGRSLEACVWAGAGVPGWCRASQVRAGRGLCSVLIPGCR